MKLIGFTLFSFLLFLILNVLGIRKFGFKDCLSAYGKPWGENSPVNNMNIWSVLVVLTSFFLVPPLIQSAEGNPLQCIAFLAPVSLILTALTPEYKENKKEWWIHQIGTWLCIAGVASWMIFIMHIWLPFIVCAALFASIGFATRTIKESIAYYGEMAMYLACYWCLLS